MSQTPDLIKRVMGSSRRHTIREGKMYRLSKVANKVPDPDDQEGLVSSYVNNLNKERGDMNRRQSLQSAMHSSVQTTGTTTSWGARGSGGDQRCISARECRAPARPPNW